MVAPGGGGAGCGIGGAAFGPSAVGFVGAAAKRLANELGPLL